MIMATTNATALPALKSWAATKRYGQTEAHSFTNALGTFTISAIYAANGINATGWKLTVSPRLPYGASGRPYQLDQVNDIKQAAKLVKSATAYANDRPLRLRVMQACLDN